jgi:xanthine dehydrogenase accessory factor
MPPDCRQRVHPPTGLDIGAVAPAEIAVSILAELIAVSHGVDTSSMSMKSVRIKAE